MAELLTLARPYAKAVFDNADENGCLKMWSEQLGSLAVLAENSEMRKVTDNPSVSREELIKLYAEFIGTTNEQVLNLLRLLAENKRLALLPQIHLLFEQHKQQAEQRMSVEVISAFELTAEQQELFSRQLEKKFNKKIDLHCKQDASLLGGAILRAGDQVFDGSVRGKLSQMAESLCA